MRRISDLNTAELLELVEHGELNEAEVVQVLRNSYCTPEIAAKVADNRQWLSATAVRERLASFRSFSVARSLDLLATLPWASLLRLAQTPRTPPVVRRQAERKLVDQVSRMTLGEKVALARGAHRPLFPSLIATSDEAVLTALLDNPRLVETNVLVILNTARVTAGFLATLARHHRWGQYYSVRRALVECRHAPLPLALSALVQLHIGDVRQLATRPGIREEIREAARALAEKQKAREVITLAGDADGGACSDPP